MYILKTYGPTGFLLKEEGEAKELKVYIGDPHSCTCSVFQKEKDLCKHISWLLLKKYKIPREDPATWQLGLVEREIQDIIHKTSASAAAASRENRSRRNDNATTAANNGSSLPTAAVDGDGRPTLEQRDIGPDDVCPICQDGLLAKHEPVTYCRYGCANSIHIKCMKIWADHQVGQGDTTISCPFCREDFGPFSLLKEQYRNAEKHGSQLPRHAVHDGTACRSCRVTPIVGKCYRCAACNDYYLCQTCLNKPIHQEHTAFEYRQTSIQRWKPADRNILGGSALPAALVSQLMSRPITDQDYELLLQLDTSASTNLGMVTEQVVNSLPLEKVRAGSNLLAAGAQCRVCLRAYEIDQKVRRLPCRHKFHKDCIDSWLLHQRGTCPVDGTSVLSYEDASASAGHNASAGSVPSRGKPAGRSHSLSVAAAEQGSTTAAAPPGSIDLLSGILTINGTTADSLGPPLGQGEYIPGTRSDPAGANAGTATAGSSLPPTGRVHRGHAKDVTARLLSRPTAARSAPTMVVTAAAATTSSQALLTDGFLTLTGLMDATSVAVANSASPSAGDAVPRPNGMTFQPRAGTGGRGQDDRAGSRAGEVTRQPLRLVERMQLRSRSSSAERRLANAARSPSLERHRAIAERASSNEELLVGRAVQQSHGETGGGERLAQPQQQSRPGRPKQRQSRAEAEETPSIAAAGSPTSSGLAAGGARSPATRAEAALLSVGSGVTTQAAFSNRGQLRKPPGHRPPLPTHALTEETNGLALLGDLQLEGSAVRAAAACAAVAATGPRVL